MDFYERIKEKEDELFRKVNNEILNDELLLEKISKNRLIEILDIQEKLLKEYINDFNKNKKALKDIKEFYNNVEIPFEVIYRVLNFIKDKIVLYLKRENIGKTELFEFSSYLQELINYIAHIYLKKEIYILREINNDVFKDKLLIKVHIDWIEKTILAVEKENLQYCPMINVKECPFTKYLYYPESLLICLDKRLCTYLDDLHRIVHNLMDTFNYHLHHNEWVEAYFVFKDFASQYKKFVKTISDMYYLTYSNPEKNFFKLLELLAFEKRIYASMIDFLNYDELIKKYSEEKIIKAINILEEKIYNNGLYADSFLVIKGTSAAFYMLNVNITASCYRDFIYKLKQKIDTTVTVDEVEINFKPVIIGAEIDIYKSLKDNEFFLLLTKLEKRAIEEKKEILLLVEEQKKEIDEILEHKYDGQYILNAFDNENIEIAAQPIFDAKANTIVGIEILGRVFDENKLIPMQKFYTYIKKMDLLKSLDIMVGLKTGDKGKLIKKISDTIFINVGFETLLNKDYIANMLKLKEKYGLNIILEISDIEYDTKYKILIDLYEEYGLKFAIDDFEKQCFSLEIFIKLLAKGVIKYIKISKHIFYDKYSLIMLEMVKYLEKMFNVQIIVKYVENEELYEKIVKNGFSYAQGFYLKTPRSVEELLINPQRDN